MRQHNRFKPGAVIIVGGDAANKTTSMICNDNKTIKVSLARASIIKEDTKKTKADELEDLIQDCKQSILENATEEEMDMAIQTITSGLKSYFFSIAHSYIVDITMDELFQQQAITQAFNPICHVIKIIIQKRKIGNYHENMLKSNCKFAFAALQLEDSKEEFEFFTVIDYLIDMFIDGR